MKNLWNRLFYRPADELSIWAMIYWWEKRRIAYNVIVGVVGMASFVLFLIFINAAHVLEPGEDAEEPLGLILAAILLNMCYTCGEITDLLVRWLFGYKPRLGPFLLKIGMAFSLFLVLLPSAFWGAYLLWKILH